MSISSCNQLDIGSTNTKGGLQETIPASQQAVFETLHKQIYEDPAAARNLSFKILDTLNTQDHIAKVTVLKYVGSSYVFETNYPEAIQYYNQALALAEEIQYYYEIANINNNLGTIFNEFGNYKAAFVHFITALDNYDLAEDRQKKNGTLNNIGLTYLNLHNHNKALTYFEKALNASPPTKRHHPHCFHLK